MAVDKLKPDDPRAPSLTATVRGKTYSYRHAKPSGSPRGTVMLIHGFPDLGFGWRHQVPYLLSLGLQVIVPDMIGYGGTDAPRDLALYSLKSISDDLAELVRQIIGPEEQIILGGHDWGGMVVWRFVLWHPEMVKGAFTVCTPYVPILTDFVDIPLLIKKIPNFAYQAQLAGPDVEREIGSDPAKLRGLLSGIYDATGPDGCEVFTVDHGVHFENVDKMGKSPLLDDDEVDYYVKQYARNGMRGPLNWYRTRKINYEEELVLLKDGKQPKVQPPSMLITARNDPALPPRLAKGTEVFYENLKIVETDGTHWALWEPYAAGTNAHIGAFVEQLLGDSAKASI